jgi:tetratricopeptide (TPR) repeat protein
MKPLCLLVLLLVVSGISSAGVFLPENGRHSFEPSSPAPAVGHALLLADSSGKKVLSSDDLEQLVLPDAPGPSGAVPSKTPADSAATLNQKAKRLIKKGHSTDTEKALSLLGQAIVLDPGYSETYHNRGQIFMDRKDYDNAVKDFREGLALDMKTLGPGHPQLGTSYASLGAALYKLGDFNGAAGCFQQALDIRRTYLDEKHPLVKEAKEYLERATQQQQSIETMTEQQSVEMMTEQPSVETVPAEEP